MLQYITGQQHHGPTNQRLIVVSKLTASSHWPINGDQRVKYINMKMYEQKFAQKQRVCDVCHIILLEFFFIFLCTF